MLTNLISFFRITLLTYLSYFHILSIPICTTIQHNIRDEYESAIQ